MNPTRMEILCALSNAAVPAADARAARVPWSYNSPMLLLLAPRTAAAKTHGRAVPDPVERRSSNATSGTTRDSSEPEQARVRDAMRVLVAEKNWLGRGGLFISEEMTVTIAAQAALLLIGDDRGYYRRVRDIVVFPTTFRTPVAEDDWEDDELSDTISSGQAVDRGPVLLAWDQVLPEGRNPEGGYNVVVHEFAHQLDFSDQLADGTPPLGNRELESRWRYVLVGRLRGPSPGDQGES